MENGVVAVVTINIRLRLELRCRIRLGNCYTILGCIDVLRNCPQFSEAQHCSLPTYVLLGLTSQESSEVEYIDLMHSLTISSVIVSKK